MTKKKTATPNITAKALAEGRARASQDLARETATARPLLAGACAPVKEWKAGAVCRLAGGGPAMTVCVVSGDSLNVAWVAPNGQLHMALLPMASLRPCEEA
jgi:uncharacterized protein YodC (DUF2158 family)